MRRGRKGEVEEGEPDRQTEAEEEREEEKERSPPSDLLDAGAGDGAGRLSAGDLSAA